MMDKLINIKKDVKYKCFNEYCLKLLGLKENKGKFQNLIIYYDNVKILNYYNDDRFIEEDFYDWQHINFQGACKLTNFIKGDMLK